MLRTFMRWLGGDKVRGVKAAATAPAPWAEQFTLELPPCLRCNDTPDTRWAAWNNQQRSNYLYERLAVLFGLHCRLQERCRAAAPGTQAHAMAADLIEENERMRTEILQALGVSVVRPSPPGAGHLDCK